MDKFRKKIKINYHFESSNYSDLSHPSCTFSHDIIHHFLFYVFVGNGLSRFCFCFCFFLERVN